MGFLSTPEFWVAVSFFIFLGALFYFGVHKKIATLLDARAAQIAKELEEARRLREEAEKVLADYRRKQSEAASEADSIIALAAKEAESLAAETRKSVKEHFERRMKLAEDKIARAEADAVREVRSVAVDAAVAAAQALIAAKLTPDRAEKLVSAEHRHPEVQAELSIPHAEEHAPACVSKHGHPSRRPLRGLLRVRVCCQGRQSGPGSATSKSDLAASRCRCTCKRHPEISPHLPRNRRPHGSRPLLIYDGDCGFCVYWARYWQKLTGDRVDYRPYQQVAARYPEISEAEFQRAVQYIAPDGRRASAAEASFLTLSHAPGKGFWLALYKHLPGFAPVSEWAYAFTAASATPRRAVRIVVNALAAIVVCSLVRMDQRFGGGSAPAWARSVNGWINPLNVVSGYGLFAIMTTTRREIVIEGSYDGAEWHEYEFRYKPGNVMRAPPWNIPHQPRLDWQMWFAALDNPQRLPWFWRFVERLLENEPTVTALLEKNPFADKPPTYVRAQFYDYTFAGGEQKGQWWNRRLLGESFPMVHLKVPVNRAN